MSRGVRPGSEIRRPCRFGEISAIDGQPRSTDVVAASEALIASMSADLFWEVLRQCEPV